MIQNIELIDFNKFISVNTAIVHSNNDLSILSAIKAADLGLIKPIFIGNRDFIEIFLREKNICTNAKIIDSPNEQKSAEIACLLSKNNEVSLIVKGHMHSDTLMSEFIKQEYEMLIKGSRLSHIWLLSFDDTHKPIIVTDGALNTNPSLKTKKQIIKNSIEFSKKLPNFNPKVAIISASEKIITNNPIKNVIKRSF